MGAGVIPVAIDNGDVHFLFQKTFTGRKVGHLIDFGGGLGDGEDYLATAIREFVEETETMYFTEALQAACRSEERIRSQIPVVEALFERTLSEHPDWWRQRSRGNGKKPRDWRTYFILFPYRDVSDMNSEWENDTGGRFKKRRELVWIPSATLLKIYAASPGYLWKRVRQLEDTETLIRDIRSSLLTSGHAESTMP
jgi:8-oxo-dGTP pyrophosphatase MutT (NUDIX family)